MVKKKQHATDRGRAAKAGLTLLKNGATKDDG
jgi:hypothetical protein